MFFISEVSYINNPNNKVDNGKERGHIGTWLAG